MSPFVFFSSALVLVLVTLGVAALLMNAPLWAVILFPIALLVAAFLVVTRTRRPRATTAEPVSRHRQG